MFPQIEVRPACPHCESTNTRWNGSNDRLENMLREGGMVRRICIDCSTSFNVMLVSAVRVERVELKPRIRTAA